MEPSDALDDGVHRAVVDRIVGPLAVLLVGESEDELHLPVDELPEGTGAGAWLHLEARSGVVTCTADDAAANDGGERAARRRVDETLDRIRRNQGGGRFGR